MNYSFVLERVVDRIRSMVLSSRYGVMYSSSVDFSKRFLDDLVRELYNNFKYDIYSISMILGIPLKKVRRVFSRLLLNNEVEIRYNPLPRVLEEFVLELYSMGLSSRGIYRAVYSLFPRYISRIYSAVGLKTILIKYGKLSMSDRLNKLLCEYVSSVDKCVCREIFDRLRSEYGISTYTFFRLMYLSEKPCRARSESVVLNLEDGMSVTCSAIVKLYNMGYSEKFIRSFLYSTMVPIVLYFIKKGKYRVLREKIISSVSSVSKSRKSDIVGIVGRRYRFRLSFEGITPRSIIKKIPSMLGLNTYRVYFLTKADAVRYILERIFPVLESNGYVIKGMVKKLITEWLKNNGFKEDEIREIYDSWSKIREK